jgi:3-oxoacyl-[acyl-carrier-protein] synthase-1
MIKPLNIRASTLVSALGAGKQAHGEALQAQRSGLKPQVHHLVTKLSAYYGEVVGLEQPCLPAHLARFDCRNHRLAWQALHTDGFIHAVEQACLAYGKQRVGLAMGTSTSGILATEEVLAHRQQQGCFLPSYDYTATHRMNAISDFCAEVLGVGGPRVTVSTACSSSAKVFASASRWIEQGVVDAVVVGGVDSLCLTTIHGFNALGLISRGICRPLDAQRDGINIGEAAGFMLLEAAQLRDATPVQLVGYGESSDAYHISSPQPEGEGAAAAMRQALARAGLRAEQVDYVNLHGTGTLSNDLAEAKAMQSVFSAGLPAHSSTKGLTGHTLGAAGITEAVLVALALDAQMMPANANLQQLDPALGLAPLTQTCYQPLRVALSNSFGFGGNNASLVFALREAK